MRFYKLQLIGIFIAIALSLTAMGGVLSKYYSCSNATVTEYKHPIQNVILIAIDTLRVDRLGFMGNQDGLTPNLDEFSELSVIFDQCYTPKSLTRPSFTATFTGMHPIRNGVIDNDDEWRRGIPSLMSNLQERFYTIGIAGHPTLIGSFGFGRGFMIYQYFEYFQPLKAHQVIQSAKIELLNNNVFEVCLFMHFWDTHTDYAPGTVGTEMFTDINYEGIATGEIGNLDQYNLREIQFNYEDARHVMDLYNAEVWELDQQLGEFFKWLQNQGYFNNSLVVIWADHGESLGENHFYTHGKATECELHVPLMMHFPGNEYGGTRVPGLISVIDILPTVLDIVDLDCPEVDGYSHYPRIVDPTIPGREYQLEIGGTFNGSPIFYVFDGSWRTAVDTISQDLIETTQIVDEADLEMLSSLGYLGD